MIAKGPDCAAQPTTAGQQTRSQEMGLLTEEAELSLVLRRGINFYI